LDTALLAPDIRGQFTLRPDPPGQTLWWCGRCGMSWRAAQAKEKEKKPFLCPQRATAENLQHLSSARSDRIKALPFIWNFFGIKKTVK